MIQLIYLSDRPQTVSDETIVDDIVLPAMRFNERSDITGCLWFGREHFLQILEGPEEEVRALYARIEKDQRHRNIRLLMCDTIMERSFPRFGMKYIRGNDSEQIRALIEQFAPARSAPTGLPLVESSKPDGVMTEPMRTVLVAVKWLAFWKPRPNVSDHDSSCGDGS